MIEVATTLAFSALAVAVILAGIRLVRGPSLPDRVVSLDLIAILSLGMVAILTVRSNNPVFLDIAIVIALLSFLGTVAFARYLERSIGS